MSSVIKPFRLPRISSTTRHGLSQSNCLRRRTLLLKMLIPATLPDLAGAQPRALKLSPDGTLLTSLKPRPDDRDRRPQAGKDHAGQDHAGQDHAGQDHAGQDHARSGRIRR